MAEAVIEKTQRKGLLGSSLIVGAGTMLSRVLGLARDISISHVFGAGGFVDAFFVAFKIPNFLRRLFAEGAFSQAFVPVLAEYKEKGGKAGVKELVAHVEAWLGLWVCLVTAVLIIASPWVGLLFAPGFWLNGESAKLEQASFMIQITAPYLFFISLTALSGSILNTYRRFAIPAITPVLLNLSLIFFSLWAVQYFEVPVHALAWGVFVAGLLQFLFQLPFLYREGVLVSPKFTRDHAGVKQIRILMLPALFGVSVGQINLLLDTVLASLLADGSVSWLYYSDRLVELPLGIIGIAIATVVLPSLSKDHAAASGEFSKTIDWALRLVLVLGVPAAIALIVLAEPLLSVIFYHGEMDYFSIQMATLSLRAYAVGLLAFMLVKVLAPGFYARQDTKTPVKIAIWAMVANMVLNLLLVFWLQHAGLALATALSSWLNAGLLFLGLRKEIHLRLSVLTRQVVFKIIIATLMMVLLLEYINVDGNYWQETALVQRLGQLVVLVFSGLLTYLCSLLLLGARLKHLRH